MITKRSRIGEGGSWKSPLTCAPPTCATGSGRRAIWNWPFGFSGRDAGAAAPGGSPAIAFLAGNGRVLLAAYLNKRLLVVDCHADNHFRRDHFYPA